VVVKQALPRLVSAIDSTKKEESWIAASGIDLVSGLVQGAPESGLGEGFFQILAAPLFSCLSATEDRDVLQVKHFVILPSILQAEISLEWYFLLYPSYSKGYQTVGNMERREWSKRP
jgi:hypothetical protein